MKVFIAAACTIAALALARPAVAQKPAIDAKLLFEQNCKGCHGPRGLPTPAMVKMMKVPKLDAAYFVKHTEDSVVVAMKKGRGTYMKSYADKLTPDQMLAVARYLEGMATPQK